MDPVAGSDRDEAKSANTSHKHQLMSDSTQSFWHTSLDTLDDLRTTEVLPRHSDIIIVGAGYAGIATAYHVIKDAPADGSKQTITILEARGLCSGATGRNGGHLRPDLYGHIPKYIERAGIEAGAEIAQFETGHIEAVKQVIEKEKIECDFRLARTVEVWTDEASADGARRNYDQMMKYKLGYMNDVIFTYGEQAQQVSGVAGARACASYTAGMLWPYKFILGLLRSILPCDQINVQTYTPVTAVRSGRDGLFHVSTERGDMTTAKVVYANNACVAGLLPEYTQSIVPCKGICTRVVVDPKSMSCASDANVNSYVVRDKHDVMTYLLPRPDGSLIVGGSSQLFFPHRSQWYNTVDDGTLIPASDGHFDDFMQRTFNAYKHADTRVAQVWTGIMGYSYDSLPHIGQRPEQVQHGNGDGGEFVMAGFNGHGMPVIFLAARAVARMVRDGVSYEETDLPRLYKTTEERICRAREQGEEHGDILCRG